MKKFICIIVCILPLLKNGQSHANDLNLVCKTNEIDNRMTDGNPIWTAEISQNNGDLLWTGPANEIRFAISVDERRFSGKIECTPGSSGICIKTIINIDRLSGNFAFLKPDRAGASTGTIYKGQCEKSALKKQF